MSAMRAAGKDIVATALNTLGLVSSAAATAYFLIIVRRTEFFARSAAVGDDVVWIVMVTCAAALALPSLAIRRGTRSRVTSIVLAVVGASIFLTFVLLLAVGKFGPFRAG